MACYLVSFRGLYQSLRNYKVRTTCCKTDNDALLKRNIELHDKMDLLCKMRDAAKGYLEELRAGSCDMDDIDIVQGEFMMLTNILAGKGPT